jgi:REP element-mobilizing transposase RayT
MRMPRILEALTWYWVVTAINRHEPLFLDQAAVELFNRVLREAGERFAIEVRHLVIQADRVSFYIKPVDGFQLPVIMQWIKQTFACRYNAMKRLDGHTWGDRYWSKVLDGEPPEEIPVGESVCGDCVKGRVVEEEEGGQVPKACLREGPSCGDSHRRGKTVGETRKPPHSPRHAAH